MKIESIKIENIKITGIYQFRDKLDVEGLADDIRENTLLNPIHVSEDSNGIYKLLAGRRRLAAASEVGLVEIDCIVHPNSEGCKVQQQPLISVFDDIYNQLGSPHLKIQLQDNA